MNETPAGSPPGDTPPTEPPSSERPPKPFPLARTIIGLILVLLGMSILIEQLTGFRFEIFIMAVGVAFLAAWNREGKYGFLIPGAIVSGVGLGTIAETLLPGSSGHASFLLLLGAGFASIWVLDRRRKRSVWGLIVAAALAISAVGAFGVPFSSLIPSEVGDVLLPSVLMGLGLLLIFRRAIPTSLARTLTFLMVALLAIAVTAGGSDPFSFVAGFESKTTNMRIRVPDLEGRTLVLEQGSGDVKLVRGDLSVRAVITARAATAEAAQDLLDRAEGRVEESGNELTVKVEREGGGFPTRTSVDYEVSLPEDSSVKVSTGSGDVSANLTGVEAVIETGSGDVDLRGRYESLDLRTGSGDVTMRIDVANADPDVAIQTGSGDVDLDIAGDPEIEVDTGSGDIDVKDFEASSFGSRSLRIEGGDGRVVVRTGSGDVGLSRQRD